MVPSEGLFRNEKIILLGIFIGFFVVLLVIKNQ